jgi:hypothetical protein
MTNYRVKSNAADANTVEMATKRFFIIIWSYELGNLEKIKDKILKFNNF